MIGPPYGNALPSIALLAAMLWAQAAYGGTGTWTNAAGGSWNVGANWGGALIAGGSGATASFIIPNLTNDAVVTLDGNQTVGTIQFRDPTPSNSWFLSTGTGGQLNLDVSSGVPAINIINQSVTISVVLAGNKGIAKNGTGSLILSGNNTYTGGTLLNEGLLQINHANALQGAVTTAAGTTLWLNAPGANHSGALSGPGLVQVSPGTGTTQLGGSLAGFTGTLEIMAAGNGGKVVFSNTSPAAGASAAAAFKVRSGSTFCLGPAETTVNFLAALELNGAGNGENLGALRIERGAVWSGPVTLKADSFIGVQTGTGTIFGNIGEAGGSFGFTKQGAQMLALGGENTYTGPTVLNGIGGLCLKNPSALQNSTLLHTSGDLVFGRGVVSHGFTLGGLSGTGNVALQDDSAARVSIDLAVGNNNASTSHSGIISGAGSLEKIGGGTWTISGRNSYTGSTTVRSGTLRLAAPAAGLPVDLRIMPLGDSITYGYNGTNAGYRGPLFTLLTPIATNFRFIGTSAYGTGSLPASPLDQQHHEGHPSYTIDDVSKNLDGFDNARFLQYGGPERDPNGGHWFDGIPNVRDPMYPDVITMMLGTNDVTALNGVQARLHNLIAKITTLRPSARLLVAKITPLVAFPAEVVTFNGIVGSEVAAFQAAGKQVFLVDMYTGFPANGLIADGVHLNDTGFAFMAAKWRDAIVTACTTGGGPLPKDSPTMVASGGVLDLNGMPTVVRDLSGAGDVTLGSGGNLTVNSNGESGFSGAISGSGGLVKTGNHTLALDGSIQHMGSTQVKAGVLKLGGSFANSTLIEVMDGAVLELAGGTITAVEIHIHAGGLLRGSGWIQGKVVNDGAITAGVGQSLGITGMVTNNGLVRMSCGAALSATENFINHGTLDLLTAASGLPENLVNNGLVVDFRAMEVDSISRSAGTVTLKIRSYEGHRYQLQHSDTLLSDSWRNVGPPKDGVAGNLLNFADEVSPVGQQGFYRFAISP